MQLHELATPPTEVASGSGGHGGASTPGSGAAEAAREFYDAANAAIDNAMSVNSEEFNALVIQHGGQ